MLIFIVTPFCQIFEPCSDFEQISFVITNSETRNN